mmetsp:Transcript_14910/g.41218  ORF Transcript_14910/g.41218 Transcript_14910/m.41218 type:complete len:93 (+) Transcript_14910:690-968(+)
MRCRLIALEKLAVNRHAAGNQNEGAARSVSVILSQIRKSVCATSPNRSEPPNLHSVKSVGLVMAFHLWVGMPTVLFDRSLVGPLYSKNVFVA